MILDTNALSAFVDGDAGVGDALRTQARAAIPVIVLGEFRYGIAQSKRRSSYEAWLDSSLIHFDILSVTEETAIAYAALRVTLQAIRTSDPGQRRLDRGARLAASPARPEPRRALRRGAGPQS